MGNFVDTVVDADGNVSVGIFFKEAPANACRGEAGLESGVVPLRLENTGGNVDECLEPLLDRLVLQLSKITITTTHIVRERERETQGEGGRGREGERVGDTNLIYVRARVVLPVPHAIWRRVMPTGLIRLRALF